MLKDTSHAPCLVEMSDIAVASCRVASHTIIRDVYWEIREGDYWVVGGLPGTGKTALLLTVAGVQSPRSGFGRMFGKPLGDMNDADLAHYRTKVGMVFESGGRLFSQMTVAENIALPYQYHHNCTFAGAYPETARVMELTEIAAYAAELPQSLPRYLQPRVALARALVTRPQLLLLDNPLRGLDAKQKQWWLELLQKFIDGHPLLEGQPLTTVVAVEDLRLWLEGSKRLAVIRESRWHLVDFVERSGDAQHPYVEELLAIQAGGS